MENYEDREVTLDGRAITYLPGLLALNKCARIENGNSRGPKVRDRLWQLIRQYQLEATRQVLRRRFLQH